MTITRNKIIAVLAVFAAVSVAFGSAVVAHANPLRFPPAAVSATATTTVQYFVAGSTATTTMVTFDTYSNTGVSGGGGSTQASDKASLLIQLAASSTSSILRAQVQYSQDGIDWYGDSVFTPATDGLQNVSVDNLYSWTAGGTATTSKLINISAPLRYVRANFRMEGANGAVWAAIQPQKQNP